MAYDVLIIADTQCFSSGRLLGILWRMERVIVDIMLRIDTYHWRRNSHW